MATPKITVHCLHCFNPFRTFPSRVKRGNGKFCSRRCFATHRRTAKRCLYCLGEFHPRPYLVKTGKGKFCSRLCFATHSRVPLAERFWEKVRKTEDCWLWTARRDQKMGYGWFDAEKTSTAHRVSWELHNGPVPDGMCVLHKCDNPPCVRPDHLFLGTRADNNADKIIKGRQTAKLNEEAIKRIRRLRANGLSQQAIADQLGVASTTILRVLRGISWKHV